MAKRVRSERDELLTIARAVAGMGFACESRMGGADMCPFCDNDDLEGHKRDCPVKLAQKYKRRRSVPRARRQLPRRKGA